ncbi:hypothetical protein [Rhizobium sp. Root482]|nr:hypothetical protein [Rhizobium sp. Root482]
MRFDLLDKASVPYCPGSSGRAVVVCFASGIIRQHKVRSAVPT